MRAARQPRLAPRPLPLRSGRRRAGKPGPEEPTTPQRSSQHFLPPCWLDLHSNAPPESPGGRRARPHARRVPARGTHRGARRLEKNPDGTACSGQILPSGHGGRHGGATVMTGVAMEMTRPVGGRERRASRTAQRPRDSCVDVRVPPGPASGPKRAGVAWSTPDGVSYRNARPHLTPAAPLRRGRPVHRDAPARPSRQEREPRGLPREHRERTAHRRISGGRRAAARRRPGDRGHMVLGRAHRL